MTAFQYIKWVFFVWFLWGFFVSIASDIFTKVFCDGALKDVTDISKQNGDVISASTISASIISLLIIFYLIKEKISMTLKEYFGVDKITLKILLIWIILTIVVLISLDLFTYVMGYEVISDFVFNVYETSENKWLLILAILAFAPIFEEAMFRGLLFSGLEKAKLNIFLIVFITSIIWSVIHVQYDPYQMLSIFVYGLFLGFMRFRSKSILICVLMHSLSNLYSVATTVLYEKYL